VKIVIQKVNIGGVLLLVATLCVSCDTLIYTKKYSVDVSTYEDKTQNRTNLENRNKQIKRIYQETAKVAYKYGLKKCDANCKDWSLSCSSFKNENCEQFVSTEIDGVPNLLIYTNDKSNVVILFKYAAGSSKRNMDINRELGDIVKN